MLRLYRFRYSTNVERVRLALGHKHLDAELVPIDPADRAPVIAASGQPLVPVLLDDGQVVPDSLAILRHLEARQPDPPLFPRDPSERARVDVFLDWFDRVWKVAPNAIEAEEAPAAARPRALERALRGSLDRFEALLRAATSCSARSARPTSPLAVPPLRGRDRRRGRRVVPPRAPRAVRYPGLRLFPLLDRACSPAIIEGGVREQLAHSIYEDHLARAEARGVEDPPWRDLTDEQQEVSREAADFLIDALTELGFELLPLRHWGSAEVELTPDEVESLWRTTTSAGAHAGRRRAGRSTPCVTRKPSGPRSWCPGSSSAPPGATTTARGSRRCPHCWRAPVSSSNGVAADCLRPELLRQLAPPLVPPRGGVGGAARPGLRRLRRAGAGDRTPARTSWTASTTRFSSRCWSTAEVVTTGGSRSPALPHR